MFVSRLIAGLLLHRHVGLWIALIGLLAALVFSFGLYPAIAGAWTAVLDPDGYGSIGRGLWESGRFVYLEDHGLTVFRGPVYPGFLALSLGLSGGWWPQGAQLAQCAVHALTVLTLFWMTRTLWGPRTAALAATLCALHPLLVWYTSRIWIETIVAFLFTAFMAGSAAFARRPTAVRAVLLGALLGAAALAKAVFLPLFAAVPILLSALRIARWRTTLVVLFAAIAVVLPWTIRNYLLTGRLILVHIGAGMNIAEGDTRVRHFAESPLAFGPLFEVHRQELEQIVGTTTIMDASQPRWKNEIAIDRELIRRSLQTYWNEPRFLLKKVMLNAWLFWTFSQTKAKTLVITALQVPVLVFFLMSAARALRQGRRRPVVLLQALLVLLYFGLHTPMEGQARYSTALLPTLLAHAVGWFAARLNGPQCEAPAPSQITNG